MAHVRIPVERLEDRLRVVERYIMQMRQLETTGQRQSMAKAIDYGLRRWQATNDRLRLDPLDRLTPWGSDDDV